MRRKVHVYLGLLGGGVVPFLPYVLDSIPQVQPTDIGALCIGAVAGGAVGGVTSLLPDLLEPPRHPNHRGPFHSVSLLLGLTGLGFVFAMGVIAVEYKVLWMLILPAIYGYVSHLAADALTKKSLPLLF
jgi:membrane-bound metal-dependent hydrolase YbcI (DUF457 family)